MIVWLSSYPKSGNTFVRSLLASYIFTKDGNFNFNSLKNISQFPDITFFEKLGVDINNEKEVVKNYIRAQEAINKDKKKSIVFLKTHSTLHSIDNQRFTNFNNTLGVIYIVRDPRSIVLSYSNHNQISVEQAAKSLISFRVLGGVKGSKIAADRGLTHVGSWSSHYNIWKDFKISKKYLLIKYEDLVSDTEASFLKILNFIYYLGKSKLVLDKTKFQNAINSTRFENMQKLEKNSYFEEAKVDRNNNPITFFKYGPQNDWQKNLPINIIKMIENKFKIEMKELGYL